MLKYFSVWYEESKNKAVIITELLQGGNLREHRKYQKKLKIKLIKKWIKQILLALDYLHSNGFIHHDIKCQNILVNRLTGNLKIGDLIGLEKVSEKGFFTKYVGTEEFMAPEAKEGKYTFKADIYSLGLTIIQFLTMEKPYKEFKRKNNLYEAKKKGILPLSFNQINNKEIQDFILLCLKPEDERPTCKELLDNPWLNDNNQQKNNVFIDIINNLRQPSFLYDKKDVYFSGNLVNKEEYKNNVLSPCASSNSLFNPKKNKQISMGPIYSLDISKLSKINSLKNDKDNDKDKEMKILRKKYKLNSFRLKPKIIPSIKGIKPSVSFANLNEKKIEDKYDVNSDRLYNIKKNKVKNSFFKTYKESDSSEFLRQEELKKNSNNLTIFYGYIIESEEKLYFILKENQEKIESSLLEIKFEISHKKWKNEKILNEEIIIKNNLKYMNENLGNLINELKKIIFFNKDDEFIIKDLLSEKIKKVLKDKKLRDFKDKMDEITRNLEFLINNEEFDDLECLINTSDFCESKLPKDIKEKLEFYEEKKVCIENLFTLYNMKVNENYNDKNSTDIVIFTI